MKTRFPAILLLILIPAVLLCSCSTQQSQFSAQQAPAETAAPEMQSTPLPASTPEPVEIYDAFYEAGYYSDDVGNTWQYTLRIPAIRASGTDAVLLNQQMYDDLYPGVKDALDAMEGEYSLVVGKVDYAIHINGNLISIVGEIDTDWGFDYYFAYNYDAGTHRIVDRAELLSRYELTEEQFISLASATVGAYFRDSYANISRDEFWTDRYEKSIAEENFTEDCGLFADDEGKLCMIVRLYSFAGADYYYHFFPLDIS